jgi:glycosyltransferase involved in cell wall biosynthesis
MQFIINGRFLSQKISGVQRFAIEITKCLLELYPDTLVLCPHDADLTKEFVRKWNIKVIGKNRGHRWEQWDLPLYLRKNGKPYLLNLCNTAPLLYSQNLVTIHDVCFAKHKEWFSTAFKLYYNFLVPRILKKSIAVFTVSEFSKSEIISFFDIPSSKIFVIPNAVSSHFSFKSINQEILPKEKIILSVASIDPRKNQAVLVKAFERLQIQDWKLYLVGAKHQAFSGQNRTAISSPNIIWTGYLEDKELIELYHKASVFVYPSLYEGFGIPPLEAMMLGCPTIVSDIPALRETCAEASLFFDPLNYIQLAVQLTKLIESETLQIELVSLGLKRAQSFNWTQSASIMSKSIDKIVFL